MKVKVTQLRLTLCDPMDYTVHGILQTKILEWVAFPFSRGCSQHQGLNPGLLHCRRILYQLSHKGSPGILEWVTHPFSRGSSQPRNRTGVSCIAGWFFIIWATKEDRMSKMSNLECPKLDSFPLPPNLVFSSVQLHCSNGSSILWGILVTNPISNLFYEVIIILKAKIKQRWQENYKLIPLINLDIKILNEIWVNQVQQYRKRIRGNAEAGAYCRNAGLVQLLQNQLM